MKAPLSIRIQNMLSDKDSSKQLMNEIIKGERNGSHSVQHEGKSFEIKRVSNRVKHK